MMMKIKIPKSAGRPEKNQSEKLKYKVTVKLATEDYYQLKGKIKDTGLNRSEYIRQCIRKSTVKSRLTPEQSGYIRKLCGMANNLNQVARKANSEGYRQAMEKCNELADSIDMLIVQINKTTYDG